MFVFKTVGEAVDLVRGFQAALSGADLRIGWKKSGIIAENRQTISRVRNAVKGIYLDVDIPDATEGYKYLDC